MLRKIFSSKKALLSASSYWSDWAELFFLILLFIGIVFGILSPSAVITYLVGFFAGVLAGRFIYERKDKLKAPYLLIVIGFVMGYVIGTFHGYRIITLLLFIIGAVLSFKLFEKGIIKDISF